MRSAGNASFLIGAGLLSEVVYLAATVRLPWWRYGGRIRSWSHLLGGDWVSFAVCLAGIGVLMAAYLWGWRVVRSGGVGRRAIWGFAVFFAATLFWLMPITSDLFTYLSQAYLFTDLGGNPLFDAPLDFDGSRLLQAYPALYATSPSVYGPAWLLISAPATLGSHDVAGGVFYLKGLCVLAYLGCGWFLEKLLQKMRPAVASEGLYLFAWNPLVLLMAVGDGHNDIVMMAIVLVAVWFLLREQWVLAFGSLALSAWIKYASLIVVPFFAIYVWRHLGEGWRRKRQLRLAEGGLAVAVVSILVFVPFWDMARISEIAVRLLRPVNWHGGARDLSTWALGVGLLLFAGAYLWLAVQLFRERGSFQQLADSSFLAFLLAFILGAARSQPWHLIWPAALAGLSGRWWAWPVVVALSAAMLAVQCWVEWGAPGLSFLL